MLPRDLAEALPSGLDRAPASLTRWLLSPAGLAVPAAYKYVAFVKQMLEVAHATAEVYDLRSGAETLGKKEHLRHIGPHEMVYLANQLYVLDSFGVPGGLLECGVSHGFSTCVLSHACARLGRTLYAADSYAGLPATRPDQEFFREGDYAASLPAVQRNLAYLGRPEAVTYIEGFYCDSLRGFAHPLCLLWLDVDLYESAHDVIGQVFGHLDQRGAVFTHEFTDFHNQVHPRDARVPANAVYDHLDAQGVRHRSSHLMRYFGMIGFETSQGYDAPTLLAQLLEGLYAQDERWRRYTELRDSRTVRTAFSVKQKLDRVLRPKSAR